jgi:RNA polymerase sigma factor (sigma-70 family)
MAVAMSPSHLKASSDDELVHLARAGDERAFDAIYARYRGPLTAYCERMLPRDRAEDVAQETLISAYGQIGPATADLRLKSWLYTVARNGAIDALRATRYHEELDERTDGVERPDQRFEGRERLRSVVDAIETLPANQRRALVMREFEGCDYHEVASRMGVSTHAATQLLHRARTALRNGASALAPVFAPFQRLLGASEGAGALAGENAVAAASKLGVILLACGTLAGGGALVTQSTDVSQLGERETPPAASSSPAAERTGTAPAGWPGDRMPGARSKDVPSWLRSGDGPVKAPSPTPRAGSPGAQSDGGRAPTAGGGKPVEGAPLGGLGTTPGSNSGPADSGSGSGSGGSGSGGSGSGGPGSGGSSSGSSGAGSSGSGSSGSGSSGSGSSGSGSSGSGSSGSGSSGSGSSGSGSSGSGSYGSGSSGSGSSGSGSGSSGSGSVSHDSSGPGSYGTGTITGSSNISGSSSD